MSLLLGMPRLRQLRIQKGILFFTLCLFLERRGKFLGFRSRQDGKENDGEKLKEESTDNSFNNIDKVEHE